MRRIPAILFLLVAGCSTAPVADFLDLVAPGGPPQPAPDDTPWAPRSRPAMGDLPPPANDAPPLPPVPSGYTPRSAAPEPPAARLVPRPTG